MSGFERDIEVAFKFYSGSNGDTDFGEDGNDDDGIGGDNGTVVMNVMLINASNDDSRKCWC